MTRLEHRRRLWAGNIVRARKAAGLRQVDLARRLDVDQPYVSAVERGRFTPNDEMKVRIAGALGKRSRELFPLDDDEEVPA